MHGHGNKHMIRSPFSEAEADLGVGRHMGQESSQMQMEKFCSYLQGGDRQVSPANLKHKPIFGKYSVMERRNKGN